MFKTSETTQRILFRTFCIMLLVLATAGLNVAYAEDCTNVTRGVDLNTTWKGFNLSGYRVEMFEIEVSEPGILAVDATAPIGSPELKMALFDESCQPVNKDVNGLGVIERFVAGTALQVRIPGTYRFGVALQNPSHSLSKYWVSTRFVSELEFCQGLTRTLKTMAEAEPEPDLFETCFTKTMAEAEPEPDLSKTMAEAEPEPDLLRTGLSAVSPLYEYDDHADTFLFATSLTLGEIVTAELDSRWRQDSDVFVFSLKAQTTVLIEVSDKATVRAGLYDEKLSENGQALQEQRFSLFEAPLCAQTSSDDTSGIGNPPMALSCRIKKSLQSFIRQRLCGCHISRCGQ